MNKEQQAVIIAAQYLIALRQDNEHIGSAFAMLEDAVSKLNNKSTSPITDLCAK